MFLLVNATLYTFVSHLTLVYLGIAYTYFCSCGLRMTHVARGVVGGI